MSSDLHIHFSHDLPAMAMDVVAPDMTIVHRIMAAPNHDAVVSVPSEASFLRLHLPSGRTAILTDPGNLHRTVSMEDLNPDRRDRTSDRFTFLTGNDMPRHGNESGAGTGSGTRGPNSRRELRNHFIKRSPMADQAGMQNPDQEIVLGRFGKVSLFNSDGILEPAKVNPGEHEVFWRIPGPPSERPFDFFLVKDDGTKVSIRIPGNLQKLWMRADWLDMEKCTFYSLRGESAEPVADTILNYLQQGDLTAAAAMSEWAEKSESLLQSKMSDPYAATVGAYLLLKLQDLGKMHDWSRNLADNFAYLPDGCIIWAWQLIQQEPARKTEIVDYLLRAESRGIPIYTQGLRLLLDGLRLIGEDGSEPLERIRSKIGAVVWESPLTTLVSGNNAPGPGVKETGHKYDIRFWAEA